MQRHPLDYRPPRQDSNRPVSALEWALATIVAIVFLSVLISLLWYLVVN